MSNDTPISNVSKLMITQESVLRIVKLIYDLKGYEVAMSNFEQMNAFFSTELGWAEAAVEVYKFFSMKRKEEIQLSRVEKLEEQRAGAPSIIMMNQNEANGVKDSRKVFNRDITMTGEQAVYNEAIDDKH